MSGTGRVYKRGTTWWIDYSFQGERYRESSESKKKKDATDLLKKRLGDLSQGSQGAAGTALGWMT